MAMPTNACTRARIFNADVETIVERAHKHQNAGAGKIKLGVRDRLFRNPKREAQPGINGNTADQRNQPLMAFAIIGFIYQTNTFCRLAGNKEKSQRKQENK